VKQIRAFLPLIVLLGRVPLLQAQGPFDVAIGFGSYHDTATGKGIENINSLNPFAGCTPSPTDPTCEATPGLGRVFMGLSADGMLSKHFGIGGGLNFQPAKGNYGPLLSRQLFYDFNGIYAPINLKRVQLRLEGGIGGSHTGFSFSQSECVGIVVCSTYVSSVGASSHFQVHVGAGVQIYVTQHIFIRPQLDFRMVPSFTDQFGADHVVGGIVWLGYNFGQM
jgi:hypothetical protein